MLGTRRRGPKGLAALLLAGATCALVTSSSWAGAQAPSPVGETPGSDPNPTTTNVPYLAWRGENIRLVKCSDDLTDAELSALEAGFNSDKNYALGIGGLSLSFAVEEWGGSASDKPELLEGTREFFLANGALCARGTFTSHDPGLARIKMAVGVTSWQLEGLDDLPSSLRVAFTQKLQLLQHQFLAGWMTLSDPTLTELPLGGDGPNDANNPLGSGVLNSFFADSVYYGKDSKHYNDGIMKVQVTGTLPVKGLGTIKMPEQFPALAAAYATDANPDNENPSNRWDIHDESALESFTTEGHPYALAADVAAAKAPYSECKKSYRPDNLPAGVLDAVDNCDGGYAFSRVFDADGPGAIAPIWLGLSKEDSTGPFDPQRPDETFLPDGRLTADDAPMPSARINFTIDQNNDLLKPVKDQKDISGVGSLHKTDKSKLYSADRKPNTNQGSGYATPHNLYAPFYDAYVPATGAPEAHASGTDGLPGNSFTGYLVGDGQGGEGDWDDDNLKYDYWDIAHEYTGRTLNAVYTQCLRRNDEGYNKDNLHPYRMTPEGPQKVAIYTDEHGIGHVNFRPGSGFWFNALMNTQSDLGGNANGGCDLKYLKDSVLGYSDITASSHYPNQPVSGNPEGTATIRKTVKSLFAKYLAVYPKGSTEELRNARIVVAHAQDIDGSPFANEVVCFVNTTRGNDGVTPFIPTNQNGKQKVIGPYDVSGTYQVQDPDNGKNSQRICLRTNEYGNAAVEVMESQGNEINVIADFTAEGILRDVKIPFGSPSLDPIDPGAPGRPAAGGNGAPVNPPAPEAAGNTTPTPQTLAVLAANNVQVSSSRTRRAARASVRFARVVNSARGTRYLSVRLQGRASRAQIRIQLVGYNGKTIRTVRRSVAVGRTVRLRNVRLGANVANARVSIIR